MMHTKIYSVEYRISMKRRRSGKKKKERIANNEDPPNFLNVSPDAMSTPIARYNSW